MQPSDFSMDGINQKVVIYLLLVESKLTSDTTVTFHNATKKQTNNKLFRQLHTEQMKFIFQSNYF